MARGMVSPDGAERTAPNGYQYVKVAERGWVLKHWLIWEEANGRRIDKKTEQVRFKDGNRNNMSPENIVVIPKGKVQIRAKLARLYIQRDEVIAMIKYYERQLETSLSDSDDS